MSKAVDRALKTIDHEISVLMKEWDMFFQGLRKVPPTKEKANIERQLRTLRNSHIHDNALRFRMMNLQTRFNTYSEMWNRRMRELEEGPLHFKQRERVTSMIQEKMKQDQDPAEEESPAEKDVKKPEDMQPKMEKHGGNGPATVIHNPDTESALLHDLYDRYVESMKKTQSKKASLTYELFAMNVEQQVETLERIKKCDAVAVSVQSQDGKVKLKFRPVKEKS